MYAWQDELSAAEFQAALDAAKQDAERVRTEFVESLPADSPAYGAEWTHPVRQQGSIDLRILGGARS